MEIYMKLIKKKILVILVVCFMLGISFSAPVLAATNTISKAIRLNTNGKTNFSLGSSVSTNSQVAQVKVSINISNGSAAPSYTVYIESPKGTMASFIPSTGSKTYIINSFDGENPKGTWSAWIEKTGEDSSPDPNYLLVTITVGITIEQK